MNSVFTSIILAVAAMQQIRAASVTFQAESGTLGADWVVSNSASPAYITITTDSIGSNPGSALRVATYTITFPAAGTFQLYARVLVGPDGYDDDSLFYGNGFGMKSPTNNSDWVFVNGLAGVGFSNSTDVVTGAGSLGSGMWKWINLSQFTGQSGYTVSAGNLTQTFEIGARENGLDLDKFVFGTSSYMFTVSNLDNGTDGVPLPPPSATIDTTRTYQTIEGLGGAVAFYDGWVAAHPYKLEIYTNAFAGLNLSMLRLGDWYRYNDSVFNSASGEGGVAHDIVSNANRILGHPVPVYMSSWSSPAFLKSNGQTGNGGTLIYTNGSFNYTGFAQYWYDTINAYKANGVDLTWISIQNEPDWVAGYDCCVFHPTEDTVNRTNYASYSKALDAVYQRLASLPSPPRLLAPEPVHIAYNDLRNYAATMNANSFYGVAYHLYGDSPDGTADGFIGNLSAATNIFPGKPHFMTEYGVPGLIQTACLINNCLTYGQDSGFNYWSLIWPGTGGGLIQIENPWNRSSWTNAPPGTPTQSHGWWLTPSYWAMKHFSYLINPGYLRVSASDNDPNVRCSAFLSPDNLRLVTVLINTNATVSSTMNFNFGICNAGKSSVYQTVGTNTYAGTNTFLSLGPLTNLLVLPPLSVTTVVLDQNVFVGPATHPSPANGASGVALNSALSWTPGSNALAHAVYLGVASNAVAQATTSSPQFLGAVSNNLIYPPLIGGTTYYWRVDESIGVNTNTSTVWSFSTVPVPSLVHRYSFSETGAPTLPILWVAPGGTARCRTVAHSLAAS